MTPTQKTLLGTLIAARTSELSELIRHGQSAAEQHRSQSDDEAASLDITINTAVKQQVLKSARQELVKLTRKQAWLGGDDAGRCVVCGEPIPLARLSAVLGTRQCVSCAETTEE